MEVTIESRPDAGPAMGQTIPASPSASRKRAFSEVEDNAAPGPEARKASCYDGEGNQENQDPRAAESIVKSSAVQAPPSSGSIPDSSVAPNCTQAEQKGASSDIPSNSTTSTTASTTTAVPSSNTPAPADSSTKKRKVSPTTSDAKKLEKEERERLKMEEKARKEEEKKRKEAEREEERKRKEEEKRKREAEREEERKKREERKRQKEEEKRKKEEEKEKKERSQMKLNAFFTKPAASTQSSNAPAQGSGSRDSSSTAKTEASQLSDYQKEFPEFFVQSYTKLAPQHRFERDADAICHIRQKLDDAIRNQDEQSLPSHRVADLLNVIPYRRHQGRKVIPVKTILAKLQQVVNTVDLSGRSSSTEEHPREMLKRVPMKTLKFGEDVRPPYQGTFTKPLPSSVALKLCRAPNSRALPDVNYDYDSEAEWVEEEEGDDLDAELDSEESEDDEDDLGDFVDKDDDEFEGRRRQIVGDLEPICSGIRWEEDQDPDMQSYRMEIISDTAQLPIDPYSTAYWPRPRAVEQATNQRNLAGTGAPTRTTLHAFATSNAASSSQNLPNTGASILGHGKKQFPPEQLAEFKNAVDGSDLSKTGLIEVLKKRFPKIPKDVLKATLDLVAVRVGQKESEKKWVCK